MTPPQALRGLAAGRIGRTLATAGWVALAVGLSTLARYLVDPLLGSGMAYTTYFPAILLISLFLGWRAGAVTLALSTLIATFIFLPPTYTLILHRPEIVAMLVFSASATIVIAAVSYLRRSLIDVERRRVVEVDRRSDVQRSLNNSMMVLLGVGFHISRREEDPRKFYEQLSARVSALVRGLDVLAEGDGDICHLPELAERVLAPFGFQEKFFISGPPTALPAESCAPLALALYELATNATQYGALSNATGEVLVSWEPAGRDALMIRWEESGGPPVAPPSYRGLGAQLLAQQPGLTRLDLTFAPAGVTCDIEVDLSKLRG